MNLKRMAKELERAFPQLTDLVLSPSLFWLRCAAYAALPRAREYVSFRYFSQGEDDLALRELGGREAGSRTARLVAEMRQVLAVGALDDPHPGDRADHASNGDVDVVHALNHELAVGKTGYAHRSRLIMQSVSGAGVRLLACTSPADETSASGGNARPGIDADTLYRRLDPVSTVGSERPEAAYIAAYADRLATVASRHGARIIHTHSNYTNGLAGAWAARRSGIRSIYEIRGLWHVTRASLDPGFEKTRLYEYQDVMEREAVRQSDAVIVPSGSLRDWVVAQGQTDEKVFVVRPGIDTARIAPRLRAIAVARSLDVENRFVLGYLGSMTAYEGIDTILRAAALCIARGVEPVVVLVGDGPVVPQLKNLARKLGIQAYVRFAGHVGGDINDYYSIFDLCLVLRRDVPVSRMTPPLKPGEIMAAGKPLLVSKLPPLLEFGEEGISRISVDPDNVDALAEQIIELASDRERCERLGASARQWVCENLSQQKAGSSYLALYEALGALPMRDAG
jgi:glycosyltransferase involved in cell wall biosynthesis